MPIAEKKGYAVRYHGPSHHYSEYELEVFDKQLDEYRSKKTDRHGEYTWLDLDRFFSDLGAKRGGAVVINDVKTVQRGSRQDDYCYDGAPVLYEALRDKVEQLWVYKGKKEKYELPSALKLKFSTGGEVDHTIG